MYCGAYELHIMKFLIFLSIFSLLTILSKYTFSQNTSTSEIVNNRIKTNINCSVFVPHAFTPNGDGVNDALRINCPCELSDFSFIIYNDAEEIYKTKNVRQKWDGKKNGIPVDEGYYKWEIMYSIRESGKLRERMLSGDIAIIR